jgi:hypothetical protein
MGSHVATIHLTHEQVLRDVKGASSCAGATRAALAERGRREPCRGHAVATSRAMAGLGGHVVATSRAMTGPGGARRWGATRRAGWPCRGRRELAAPGRRAGRPRRAAVQAGRAKPPRWLATPGRREPGRATSWDTPGRRADPRERPAGGRPRRGGHAASAPQRETRAREGEPRHAGRGATPARMARQAALAARRAEGGAAQGPGLGKKGGEAAMAASQGHTAAGAGATPSSVNTRRRGKQGRRERGRAHRGARTTGRAVPRGRDGSRAAAGAREKGRGVGRREREKGGGSCVRAHQTVAAAIKPPTRSCRLARRLMGGEGAPSWAAQGGSGVGRQGKGRGLDLFLFPFYIFIYFISLFLLFLFPLI